MNTRMNGHRCKFVIDDTLTYSKSALSLHCFMVHRMSFDMKVFKLGIVKQARPVDLNREEDFYINHFKTKMWGLNRYVIVT